MNAHKRSDGGSGPRAATLPAGQDPDAADRAKTDDGWQVRLHAAAEPPVILGAEDLRDYLDTAMQVRVTIERSDSLRDWSTRPGLIVAGTREQHTEGIHVCARAGCELGD